MTVRCVARQSLMRSWKDEEASPCHWFWSDSRRDIMLATVVSTSSEMRETSEALLATWAVSTVKLAMVVPLRLVIGRAPAARRLPRP